MIDQLDPICALSTPQGVGAIGVIRVSGKGTFEIVDKIFKGKSLSKVESHTLHFGKIIHDKTIVDEVVAAVFRSPSSYTKEDTVEISCHGSDYIIKEILKLLIVNGCRTAQPGEFTQRAFLNGQLDLSQAEAVADLIAADSAASHQVAITQMRSGFSRRLLELRSQLIDFASLIELELDFGEEDVEFAQRDQLRILVNDLLAEIRPLIASFDAQNVIKEGVPVAIIGPPNAGKSTLLNRLLNEEKAIVTSIAGTTRDVIEDTIVVGGTKFRFVDTAGIRTTTDEIEKIGIERSKKALNEAQIVLFLFTTKAEKDQLISEFGESKNGLWIQNKIDLMAEISADYHISAQKNIGIEPLIDRLVGIAQSTFNNGSVLTNSRHFELLVKTQNDLDQVIDGLNSGVSQDFVAQDIRMALHHLGELTGTISSDDLLANIFGKFCIGK